MRSGCYFLGLLLSGILFAQQPSLYQVETRKDFISWNWLGTLQTVIPTGKSSRLQVNNQFQSTLFRQSSQTDKWRDENTLEIHWSLPISSHIQTSTIVNSRVLSDENTFIDFSKHLAAQEFSFKFIPHLEIKPALGWTVEEAFNKRDQGWYTRMGLNVSKLDMGGYLNNTEIKNVLRSFPGRKNREFTFFTGWTKRFSSYASDSLRMGYQYSENRYYINPAQVRTDIEHPQEQVFIISRFVSNQLQYQFSSRSALAIISTFRNRSIDQSNPAPLQNRRKELALDNTIQYLLTLGNFQMQSGMYFSQVTNDNPAIRTDISTLQSAFNTHITFQPSLADLFWTRFSYTKLEYNTPQVFRDEMDRNTRDDRDELRFIITGGYKHRFSNFFSAALTGNVYLFHQIYVRSGRSANNNWNRIFQLAANFKHTLSPALQHNYQLKILANYTVFDFDNLLPQLRSFLFRKLIFTDSLSIKLTDNISLTNIYQLQKEDNGTFFKDVFAQQVSKELTSHYFNVNLLHRSFLGLQVAPGLAFLLRREWIFSPDQFTGELVRRKLRTFHSLSPRLTITYPASKRLLLFFNYSPTRNSNTVFSRDEAATPTNTVQFFSSANINLQYLF